jgi:serine/threonine-protein kinase
VKLIRGDRAGDPQAIARLECEMQALAKLTHPNTVAVFDWGTTDKGQPYYVMEYLSGLDLQEIVDRTGPMSPGRVIHLLRQVCSALSEVHERGMVHCDIKPGNIFAAKCGGVYDFAKLLDFGLVKFMQPRSNDSGGASQGMIVGSPLYAAPDLMLGACDVDPRTDIYCLGATAYFLLTGRAVFPGDQALPIALAHLRQTPLPPTRLRDGIPADLEAIVLQCLAKSPEDRFSAAGDLEAALARCAQDHRWTAWQAEQWWRSAADFTSGRSHVETDDVLETQLAPQVAI